VKKQTIKYKMIIVQVAEDRDGGRRLGDAPHLDMPTKIENKIYE
jgi:hypothetical protein